MEQTRSKIDFNLLKFKQRQFIQYCINNFNDIYKQNVNQITAGYGCGISFVYSILQKLKINNWKEFLLCLFEIVNESDQIYKMMNIPNEQSPYEALLSLTVSSNISNYQKFKTQYNKIILFCKELLSYENVYSLGFGHSFLALEDFSAYYSSLNKKYKSINLSNYSDYENITEKSLLFVYSMRANNDNLFKVINKLSKNQNFKIVIFTSAPNTRISKMCHEFIEIDNIMKKQDVFSRHEVLSPITTWIYLNGVIKTTIFNLDKEKLINDRINLKEFMSWEDDKWTK